MLRRLRLSGVRQLGTTAGSAAPQGGSVAALRGSAGGEALPRGFGVLPLVQSESRSTFPWTPVAQLAAGDNPRTPVRVRARVARTRVQGKKLVFLALRDGLHSVQAVVAKSADADAGADNSTAGEPSAAVTSHALKWIASIPTESVVDVTGFVQPTPAPIKSCTQESIELKVTGLALVSSAAAVLPFQLSDATDPDTTGAAVQQATRLEHRWLDMRTRPNQAVWRLQSRVCQLFREFLSSPGEDFTEIHTPKLIPAASEGSGATVFKVEYLHGKQAFLAQSPQLYKQMALQGDLTRVFEIGPVFRAEDSNTHRHLCEFTGLDVEMEVKEHYYEVLDVADGLFSHIFDNLPGKSAAAGCDLVAEVAGSMPGWTPFVHRVPEEVVEKLGLGVDSASGYEESRDEFNARIGSRGSGMLRLRYADAVEIINANGCAEEAAEMGPLDDMSTENERTLGRFVKARYGVDFYVVDQFPAGIRPFYTMPSPRGDGYSNSYDIYMRGEEVSSGAQRVHCAELLMKQAADRGLSLEQLQHYINSFTLGAWPHGGFGVGLERVLMLYLGLPNVRACSMFPRDPRRIAP
ncbi:Aspartate--tRNA ligase [Diplonema papillatum]|nr:Aspartate--tRNA ligase [Diplonema papillatum]